MVRRVRGKRAVDPETAEGEDDAPAAAVMDDKEELQDEAEPCVTRVIWPKSMYFSYIRTEEENKPIPVMNNNRFTA